MIRGLSGTAIMEEGGDFEYGEGNEGGGEVKDLEHGVKQGGKVRVNNPASVGAKTLRMCLIALCARKRLSCP